ncbi:lytic transglycosylase domain-containing protein [Bacteriovorax sp. DB6_IX]|uniref:lytic transglycosylase domain-containing protein n=1 Tax=Bacteriovorax sp. DB6_IX TaxID=1353530 RepID=UPI00038A4F11|nr:transglycosylase SLT domain-containing protein [Bacteriovorax sp. DB6_IX]EQC52774.1 transglycosylase SLT domain protein [Bacteriovorax sp. DB6_IX]
MRGKVYKNCISLIHLGVALGLLCSCAGPMNPFSSDTKNIFSKNKGLSIWEGERKPATATGVDISFYPKKQNWHESHDFYIILESDFEILNHNNIKLFWNHKDITPSLNNVKEIVYQNKNNLIIKVKGLRLLANNENDIHLYYVSSKDKSVYGRKYDHPTCEINEQAYVYNTSPFNVKESFIKLVEKESVKKGINPSMMTALIAQESGFDAKSVSHAKAIGLTQVTNLASHHVLKKHQNWKADRRIKKLPVPILRTMIKIGKISKKHDWRLDKRKSVQGGLEYIKYLERYWNGNIDLIERAYGTNFDKEKILTELILASYNSGPYRIKMRLIRDGKLWARSKVIKEAKNYIGKVKSFCYHFNQNKGGFYENQASNF